MIEMLRRLGRSSLTFFERLGRGTIFFLYVLAAIPALVFRPGLVIAQTWSVGVRSLIITVVSGVFVGMVET